MPWLEVVLSCVGVIVSYVELKKGEEDAFFSGGLNSRDEKAAVPFVHGTAA
jgi:hypothetical protein